MNRGGFLKSLITLIAAPSLLGEMEIKPHNPELPQTFNSEIIRFYSGDINKFRLGDFIVSDMGDKAMITGIVNIGKPYAEARPLQKGVYRYSKLENVLIIGRHFKES